MEKKRVSMREIAKECGCSLATVSYALNHAGGTKISSATRLKVIATTSPRSAPPGVSPGGRSSWSAQCPAKGWAAGWL